MWSGGGSTRTLTTGVGNDATVGPCRAGGPKAVGSVIEVFRASDVPARDRLDYMHQVVTSNFGPHELRMPNGPDPPEELRVAAAGAVRIGELRAASPRRTDRTARHARQDPGTCTLHVVARGRFAVRHKGREATLGPGDLVLVDGEKPVSKVIAAGRFATVVFPKALLPLGRDEVSELSGRRFDGREGLVGLASSFVRQVVDRLGTWDEPDGARLGTAMLDLLSVALSPHLHRDAMLPADGRQRTLLAGIYGFIEEHLGDPELSPATVAAANHVSVRYLHRQFETHEATVAAWIRRRRLDRCRRDLADPTMRSVPISTIAARWGLTDATHFGRQFRAAYGLLPSEYRRAAAT
jgi:AraC-like DNA-binding protein